MKRIAAISLQIIIGLVVLGIVTVFALSYFVNPDRIKPIVINRVEQSYNRSLQIGDMRWRVFPRLGITVSDVSLGNNPLFGEGVFAAFKNVTVFVDTLSLLRGHVDVKSMQLSDATANLKVNKSGANNWSDLLVAKADVVEAKPSQNKQVGEVVEAEEAGEEVGKKEEKKDNPLANFTFNIDSIEIKNAAFTYKDEKTGEAYEISNLNFSSKNAALNKDFPMDVSFDLNAGSPQLKADVKAKATMNIPANKENEINMDGIKIDGEVNIGNLLAEGMTITQFRAPVQAADGIIDLKPVTAKLYGGTFNGSVKIDTNPDPATVYVVYDLRNTQIGPMLRDLSGEQKFTGALTLQGDLTYRSYPAKKQLTRSLNGRAGLYIGRGTLHGIDLTYWYAVGNNLLNPGSLAQRRNTGKTEFFETKANFTIRNGVINNDDLVLYNDGLYGMGGGTVDLVNDKVNYRFRLQGVQYVGDNDYAPAGQVVPLVISGSLSDPNIAPDVGEIVKDQVIQGIGRELLKSFAR